MEDKYTKLKQIIKDSKSIVVFSGAGISTESGIKDFRSDDGLYNEKLNNNYSPEEIISHSFFINHTLEFYEYYKEKMMTIDAKPNIAHLYFANLEKENKRVIIITQNIDGLHQKAGSKNVIELHGSIYRNYCMDCNAFYDASYIKNSKGIPRCKKCGGIIKPDVVLYQEGLNELDIQRAISAIMTSDTMLIIGTSLNVYPAAGFVNYFKGNNLIIINKQKTQYDKMCDLIFNENIVDVIKKII